MRQNIKSKRTAKYGQVRESRPNAMELGGLKYRDRAYPDHRNKSLNSAAALSSNRPLEARISELDFRFLQEILISEPCNKFGFGQI